MKQNKRMAGFQEVSSSVFLYFSMNKNYMNLIGTMKVPLNLCSL